MYCCSAATLPRNLQHPSCHCCWVHTVASTWSLCRLQRARLGAHCVDMAPGCTYEVAPAVLAEPVVGLVAVELAAAVVVAPGAMVAAYPAG